MQPHLRAAATRGSAAYPVDQRVIALIVSRTGRQTELPFDNLVATCFVDSFRFSARILVSSGHFLTKHPSVDPHPSRNNVPVHE